MSFIHKTCDNAIAVNVAETSPDVKISTGKCFFTKDLPQALRL